MRLLVTKELIEDSRFLITGDAYRALFMHWSSRISATDTTLLGYLISRTFGMGRLAQRISFSEFTEGTQLSKTTIRQHLTTLANDGFINIFRTEAGDDGHEKEARMFEIDCNFFLDSVLPGLETHQKRAKEGVQKLDPPVQNPDPPSYINYIDSVSRNSRDKSLHSARPSRTESSQETNVFAIPKKARATAPRPEGVAAVLASVSGASRAKQADRIAAVGKKPCHMIDKLEMQAILDKAGKAYHPTGLRMIVTGKEFGFLRKRLKEQPPGDFQAFIDWTIGQWFTIASQNNTARRRQVDKTPGKDLGSNMPMAPDFAALAYRYPYFLKVFANRNAEAPDTVKETSAVESLQRKLEAAERDKETLRRQIVRAKAPVLRRTPRPPVPALRNSPIIDDLGSDDLPEWQTRDKASK